MDKIKANVRDLIVMNQYRKEETYVEPRWVYDFGNEWVISVVQFPTYVSIGVLYKEDMLPYAVHEVTTQGELIEYLEKYKREGY